MESGRLLGPLLVTPAWPAIDPLAPLLTLCIVAARASRATPTPTDIPARTSTSAQVAPATVKRHARTPPARTRARKLTTALTTAPARL